MYGQERLDDFVFKYRDLMFESKDQELETCPDCLEKDEHFTNNGICTCEVITIWEQDQTKLNFEDYKNLFFKML
jgi:hypothetical protein